MVSVIEGAIVINIGFYGWFVLFYTKHIASVEKFRIGKTGRSVRYTIKEHVASNSLRLIFPPL